MHQQRIPTGMIVPRLLLGGLAALTVASTFAAEEPGRPGRPPNVLWISCEDISPDLGCYGDSYAQTPNLDALARQGCRYLNAFATFPVCAPSRSSIITGVHPGTLGSMHMRTGNKKYEAVPPPCVKCFPEYLRAVGYYCSNHTKTDYQFAPPLTAWDAMKGDWRNPDRPKEAPFFCVINFTMTHESQSWKIDKLAHDPDKAKVPPYYPDTPVVRRNLAKYYDNISELDRRVGEVLNRLEEDGLADNTVVFFWSDHGRGLPRCKRWPYDSGLRVPLVVRWPGKIAPGTTSGELVSLIDLAPTVLSIAGVKVPAHMQGRAIAGDAKGPEPQHVFSGRNRMDMTANDFIRTVRDRQYRYIRNFTPDVPRAQEIPYMEKMPIMQEWRRLEAEGKLSGPARLFFVQPKPADELYDLAADPYEIHNLAENPEHQDRLCQMRGALEKWMQQIGDLGGLPEDELIQRLWPGGKQPITADPLVRTATRADGKCRVTLACPTEGASIAWRIGGEGRWLLYAEPIDLAAGTRLEARAVRIGFKPSDTVRRTIGAANPN